MSASSTTDTTSTHMNITGELPGLHGRLTVLPAGPDDRAELTERLARLMARVRGAAPTSPSISIGPDDFAAASREAALRRVEDHERVRSELAARLRRARELQAVTANRRDEAAARARRMSAHLEDCDGLLERAGELTNAAEEARRALDARRADVEAAHGKLVLVEEQRDAAGQMIDDAARQLRDLETSELDETTLRRELENARHALRDTEEAHAQANDAVRAIEQSAAARAGMRDHVLHERAELVARIEAPMPDSWDVREALSAFDNETRVGEPDLVARDLAREWIEVDGEIERIESALPEAPSADEMAAAERRLAQIEQTIADLETADRRDALLPDARHEIEAAHEAVLEAEEDVDQSGGHEEDLARLHEAREIEHAVLRRHGYDTYLDVILAGPRPDGDAQADLLDALRARRVAEDTVASLRAATEPPAIVTTLRSRRAAQRRRGEHDQRHAAQEQLPAREGQHGVLDRAQHHLVDPEMLELTQAGAAAPVEPAGQHRRAGQRERRPRDRRDAQPRAQGSQSRPLEQEQRGGDHEHRERMRRARQQQKSAGRRARPPRRRRHRIDAAPAAPPQRPQREQAEQEPEQEVDEAEHDQPAGRQRHDGEHVVAALRRDPAEHIQHR